MTALRPAHSPRVRALDGLRGAAVSLVLIHHFVGLAPWMDAAPGTLRSYFRASLGLTASGVDLFFVLSGYLIAGIIFDHRDDPALLRVFYLRRAARILPLAWLVVAAAWLLSLGSFPRPAPTTPWWQYFAFVANVPMTAHDDWWGVRPLIPFWSLCVEEQFYLLFPLLALAAGRARAIWLGPALMLTAFAIRCALVGLAYRGGYHGSGLLWHVTTLCRLDVIGAGVTAAALVRSPLWSKLLSAPRLCLGAALLPGSGMAWLLLRHRGIADFSYATWGYDAIALTYALLLLSLVSGRPSALIRGFENPAIVAMGRRSYFIYLFQPLAALFVAQLLGLGAHPEPVTPLQSALVVAIAIGFSWPSWALIERPILQWAARFRYRQPPALAPAGIAPSLT